MYIKTLFTLFFLFLIFMAGIYMTINIVNYFDPFGGGYLNIDGDIVSGNKETIKAAIRYLGKTDRTAYRNLCTVVDRVSEKNCIIADQRIDSKGFIEGLNLDGCYVKGTRTIYLRPDKSDSPDVIEGRARTIKHYTEAVARFWEEYNSKQ